MAALLADLDNDLGYAQNRQLQSILLAAARRVYFLLMQLKHFQGVAARIPFANDIEITLEANPGTVEAGRFAGGYQQAGVTRISIGVQSFQPENCRNWARIHDPQQAVAAGLQANRQDYAVLIST